MSRALFGGTTWRGAACLSVRFLRWLGLPTLHRKSSTEGGYILVQTCGMSAFSRKVSRAAGPISLILASHWQFGSPHDAP
jgi:hypothetical protein